MKHTFSLTDGTQLLVTVTEGKGCKTVSQLMTMPDGTKSKTCSVTCDGGKSHSWTCPADKDCLGDCSDPKNPRGSCV